MAQLLATFVVDYLGVTFITTAIWLLLLNIPVVLLGWFKVGRRFTLYSVLSIVATTAFLEVLPVLTVSNDIMLNAVFGGVIGGFGVGITLRWGASTGGSDIVAMVISRIKDKPIGGYIMLINGVIIVFAGILTDRKSV